MQTAGGSGPHQRNAEGRHGDRFRDQGARRQFTVQLVRTPPELWSANEATNEAAPVPSTEPGWFDRYATEHGVQVDDSVRLLAAGEP